MIKELLLSLAVAAFSGVSSFVGSPKKAIETTPVSFTFGFNAQYDPDGDSFFVDNNTFQSWSDPGTFSVSGISATASLESESAGADSNFLFTFDFPDNGTIANEQVTNIVGIGLQDLEVNIDSGNVLTFYSYGAQCSQAFTNGLSISISFDWQIQNYTITKNLYNCSINSTPELPNTYQTAQVGQTFVIYGAANSDLAGDYGFNSSSLSVVGASATALSLTNEIENTGYYRGCSFSVNLPANDFTITLRAYRPEYSITPTLNNCSVSPSVPSSYSGLYANDFTFTAAEGYAFNSLVPSWEFSANITAQEPTFSGKLYGSLYESVTFRLVFENGNCEFRITAVSFNLDSYSEGYDSGYSIGYDKGHADGLIAGDSYGVWNWLKQAARTTGEFLSIPLLPGFSIGGLLTALAGLVIIWLFIKGFLFKS